MEKVFAQGLTIGDGSGGPSYSLSGPISFGSIGEIIGRVLPLIFIFAGIALLFSIISAGFTMMTGAGDPKKLQAGRQQLTNGLIGFILIFCAYWIVQIVGIALGWDSISSAFPM